MTSNTNQVLGVMLRDLGQVNGAVSALNKNLASTKVLAVAAMGALAGAAVLSGMWAIVGASRALNDELSRMKMLGGDFAATIDRTRSAAIANNRATPTTTAAQGVAMQREVSGILGDPKLAAELLPDVSKAAYVASFYTKEAPETIAQNLLKMADIRGALMTEKDGKKVINWEALKPELDMAIKAMVIQGGMLKSGDLLGMIKQGSVPFRSMSAESAYLDMAELASTMGGQRTGTALTSLFQQFIGGKMTKQTAEALTAAGMLKAGDWTSGRSGGVVVTPSGTRRFAAMEGDPATFLAGEGEAKIKAYAEKEGISSTAAIFRLFGRQTSQRLVAEILSSEPQIRRSREIAGGMEGFQGQYAALMRENLTTNIQAFSAAWQTLMQVLGDAMVPTAIDLLQMLTKELHDMTEWVAANPDAVKTLAAVSAGIGAFMVVLGGAAVVGAVAAMASLASPVGGLLAVAAGITALAAALDLVPEWLKFWKPGEVRAWPQMPGGTPLFPALPGQQVPGAMPNDLVPNGPLYGPGGNPARGYDGPMLPRPPVPRAMMTPSGPLDVRVVNPGALAPAVTQEQAARAARPPAGPSFLDPRMGVAQ